MVTNADIALTGVSLARFIIRHATKETLSTHVAVSFDESDANTILHMAERLLVQHEIGPALEG